MGLAAIATFSALAPSAHAREVAATDVLVREAGALGEQLVLRLDVFDVSPEDGGLHLAPALDYDVNIQLDWRFRRARAHVRLGAGNPEVLYLRLDANMWKSKGAMRTRLRVDLAVAGEHLALTLPDVNVRPTSVYGDVGVELSVPILEGRF